MTELREWMADLDREQLERAFLAAVRAFAQYAEDRTDVPDHVVEGFAVGFVQNERLPRASV